MTTKWQGKIWASTNGYPRFREVSDAIDKRLYLIDCNTHFSVDGSGTGLKKNKDIKDVFLKQKDTLEYIFKMLLDLKYRELPVFDFQKQLKKDFRAETNPIDQFLNEITDESVRNEVVEGWDSNICPNPHWNFYPVDYLYLQSNVLKARYCSGTKGVVGYAEVAAMAGLSDYKQAYYQHQKARDAFALWLHDVKVQENYQRCLMNPPAYTSTLYCYSTISDRFEVICLTRCPG